MKFLKEYRILGGHWDQRKAERAEGIIEIQYPKDLFKPTDDRQQLEPMLDDRIKKSIKSHLVVYQALTDTDTSKPHSTIIVRVTLQRDGKIFTPVIVAQGGEAKGNAYIGTSINNTLQTLLLLPDSVIGEADLAKRTILNLNRERGTTFTEQDVVIKKLTGYNVVIDVDKIASLIGATGPETTKPEDLPYKLRTDYRAGADFESKQYGKGKIITTSAGVKGVGDAHGKLDWVDVDFGKPFLKGGQVTTVRRIPGIFTKVAFGLQ